MNRATPLLSQLTASAQARLNDPKNVEKGEWTDYTPRYCLWLLIKEIRELLWECYLIGWFGFIGDRARCRWHKLLALEEAGDVVVCLVMLLNVLGVIKDE